MRLHSRNENDSGEISALLGFLRVLSREHNLAIMLIHHMNKKGHQQLGHALRGSSDLWAWSDSSLYLTRRNQERWLTIEHRAAPAPEPFPLTLVEPADGSPPHLERAQDRTADPAKPQPPLEHRLRIVLREAKKPLSRVTLRKRLGVNNQRLGDILLALERSGDVVRTSTGWRFRAIPTSVAD